MIDILYKSCLRSGKSISKYLFYGTLLSVLNMILQIPILYYRCVLGVDMDYTLDYQICSVLSSEVAKNRIKRGRKSGIG